MDMRRILKEYTEFSIQEKRSLLIVTILILFSILFRIWFYSYQPEKIVLTKEQKQDIELFIASFNEVRETGESREPVPLHDTKDSPEYFLFNPNSVNKEELIRLGLNDFVADNLINYRKAGGKFSTPEDLQKIYGLDKNEYKRIQPFIVLSPGIKREIIIEDVDTVVSAGTAVKIFMDLNSSEFKDLLCVKGISNEIAGRILNYRDLLGGFHTLEQLSEVYDMSDTLKSNISQVFTVDSKKIRKFLLKDATFTELLRHPYLSKEDVKKIFSLREFYKDNFHFEHIIENKIFNDSIIYRISPYFEE